MDPKAGFAVLFLLPNEAEEFLKEERQLTGIE